MTKTRSARAGNARSATCAARGPSDRASVSARARASASVCARASRSPGTARGEREKTSAWSETSAGGRVGGHPAGCGTKTRGGGSGGGGGRAEGFAPPCDCNVGGVGGARRARPSAPCGAGWSDGGRGRSGSGGTRAAEKEEGEEEEERGPARRKRRTTSPADCRRETPGGRRSWGWTGGRGRSTREW